MRNEAKREIQDARVSDQAQTLAAAKGTMQRMSTHSLPATTDGWQLRVIDE
jgi:hypothetical protein